MGKKCSGIRGSLLIVVMMIGKQVHVTTILLGTISHDGKTPCCGAKHVDHADDL